MGRPTGTGRLGDVARNKVAVFSSDVGSPDKERPAVGKRVLTTAGKYPPLPTPLPPVAELSFLAKSGSLLQSR